MFTHEIRHLLIIVLIQVIFIVKLKFFPIDTTVIFFKYLKK